MKQAVQFVLSPPLHVEHLASQFRHSLGKLFFGYFPSGHTVTQVFISGLLMIWYSLGSEHSMQSVFVGPKHFEHFGSQGWHEVVPVLK